MLIPCLMGQTIVYFCKSNSLNWPLIPINSSITFFKNVPQKNVGGAEIIMDQKIETKTQSKPTCQITTESKSKSIYSSHL